MNLARNKVKALQHEVTIKNAFLKTKFCEQKERENTQPRIPLTTENVFKIRDQESARPSVPNIRRLSGSKTLGASNAHKIEAEKEKFERKRRQLRRESVRVRSAAQQVTEDLFEIKDLQLTMPSDIVMSQQDNSTMTSYTRKTQEEEEELGRRKVLTRLQDCMITSRSTIA